jgi:phage baseplate assembly protein V
LTSTNNNNIGKKIKALGNALYNKIAMIVGTGTLQKFKQESIPLVQVSGLDGELREAYELLQQYGFRSHPPVGSEVVFICPTGDRSHGHVIGTSQRNNTIAKNIELKPGETLLYGPGSSVYIHLTSTKITIASNLELEIFGSVKINGDLRVTGDITDNSASNSANMENMRNVYNTHTHASGGSGQPNQSM